MKKFLVLIINITIMFTNALSTKTFKANILRTLVDFIKSTLILNHQKLPNNCQCISKE